MPNDKPVKHILAIRLSAMGDVAMTVPVIKAFTKSYPEVQVTMLTRPFFTPLFKHVPGVSVYEADVKGKHKGIRGLWKLYKELRKLNIDVVVDLHNVLRTKILKRYFKLGSIPVTQIDKGRSEKRALTAATNKKFAPLKTTFDRYQQVFEKLGFSFEISAKNVLSKQPLSDKILSWVGQDTKKWIGVAPFAAYPGKMYPRALMAEVLKRVSAEDTYKIFLFGGGPRETIILEEWATTFENTLCVAGNLTFEEELDLISNLDLMVSMDSSNGHLAAIHGIPVITLWGVTHPYAGFAPFGQDREHFLLADREQFPQIPTSIYGNKLPKGYEKAMETISPEQVTQKIREVLGETSP